jgi:hypothetical protein
MIMMQPPRSNLSGEHQATLATLATEASCAPLDPLLPDLVCSSWALVRVGGDKRIRFCNLNLTHRPETYLCSLEREG